MSNFNRRQWLKTAGLGSTFTLLGGLANASTSDTFQQYASEDKIIRLSSNENPLGPSPRVREAITKAFSKACRYPGSYLRELTKMIADKHGVKPEHVCVTGGSTEGLKITGLTYGLNGREIITALPTFKSMTSYAEQFGAHIHRVPVNDELGYDLEEIEKRITNNTGLIFLCNPNNPTGTLLDKNKLRSFVDSTSEQTLVFSDEAYYDYITEPDYPSMVEMVKQGKNVIVSRTFSKVYGMAGLRIGYLIARPDITERLRKNVAANTNVLAIFAAIAALKDNIFYQQSIANNLEAKTHIYKTLDDLNLTYVKSHTNFIFFRSGQDIVKLNASMLDQGVRIGRPFPPFTDWARISTGTMTEVKAFTEALRRVV